MIREKSDPSVVVIDVGHGNCTIVQDSDKTFLIDTGPKSSVLEYLRTEGITQIDTVLISHADADHIGGLIAILSSGEVEIKEVYANSDSLKTSALWDDLLYELDEMNRSGKVKFAISLVEGDEFFSENFSLKILAPSPYLVGKGPGSTDRENRRISTNTVSGVVEIIKNGKPLVLCAADIDMIGIEHLVQSGIDLSQIPVVIFPHHGGKPGSASVIDFVNLICDHIKPTSVIFSFGRNKHQNPDPEVIETLRNRLPEVVISCTQLSEHCSALTQFDESLKDTSRRFSQGAELGHCCAGTIDIGIESGDASILSSRESHSKFIDECCETPLCRQRT